MQCRPFFMASEVAAIIGHHPYRSRASALLQNLERERKRGGKLSREVAEVLGTSTVQSALRKLGVSRGDELQHHVPEAAAAVSAAAAAGRDVAPDATAALAAQAAAEASVKSALAQQCVAKEGAACEAALSTSAEVRAAAAAAQEGAARSNIVADAGFAAAQAAVSAGRATEEHTKILAAAERTLAVAMTSAEARDAAAAAAAAESERQSALATALAATAAKARAEAAALQSVSSQRAMQEVLRQQVHKKRGRDEEDSALDGFAAKARIDVTRRNDKMYRLSTPNFVLGGRVDGISSDGRVVEMKTRRHWWAEPPAYDMLQLRAYMALLGGVNGVLVEQEQGGGRYRETQLVWCADTWASISDDLAEAAATLQGATAEDLLVWAGECGE